MRSRRTIATSIALLTLFATPALAQNLGYVDTHRLLTEYHGAQQEENTERQAIAAYQRELQQREAELETAQRQGKSSAQIAQMQARVEADLAPKKKRVEAMDRALSAKVKARIEAAIAQVAQERHLAMVLDKQVVLYGGEDLTDPVLRRLNR